MDIPAYSKIEGSGHSLDKENPAQGGVIDQRD